MPPTFPFWLQKELRSDGCRFALCEATSNNKSPARHPPAWRIVLAFLGGLFISGCTSELAFHRHREEILPLDAELAASDQKTIELVRHEISESDDRPETLRSHPPAPESVTGPTADPLGFDHPLTIAEATYLALKNNRDVAVLEYAPQVAATQIPTQESIFDPVFAAGGNWSRSDQQTASLIQAFGNNFSAVSHEQFGDAPDSGDQLSLFKRFSPGTTARLAYRTSYDFVEPAGQFVLVNPAWRSQIRLSLEQPLFKDFGPGINEIGIRIARANHQQTIEAFQQTINELLRDVELSYWNLYNLHRSVQAVDDQIKWAEETLGVEESRQRTRESTRIEVSQAREQLEQFRATRSSLQGELATADRQFRRLIGAPADSQQVFRLIDRPYSNEYSADWDHGVAFALENRPELKAQRFAITASDMQRFRARNALRPDVRAFAGYTWSGLDHELDGANKVLFDNRFSDWNLGIRYLVPLGQRASHAGLHAAELDQARQQAQLRNIEDRILHELQEAWRQLHAARQEIDFQVDRVQAAREYMQTLKQLHLEMGQQNVLDRYVRSQLTYTNARRDLASAVVRYNQAIVRWRFATGTISTSPQPVADPSTPGASEFGTQNDLDSAGINHQRSTDRPGKSQVRFDLDQLLQEESNSQAHSDAEPAKQIDPDTTSDPDDQSADEQLSRQSSPPVEFDESLLDPPADNSSPATSLPQSSDASELFLPPR